MPTKRKTKYSSSRSISLTDLKYRNRLKVRSKNRDNKIEDLRECPSCHSKSGYYHESFHESIEREISSFRKNSKSKIEIEVKSEIWKSNIYFCLECHTPIAYHREEEKKEENK